MNVFSFVVDSADTPGWTLLVQCPAYDMTIWASREELLELSNVPALTGDRSLALGRTAGSRVFWGRSEAGDIYVLVGHDDETWEIGVTIPEEAFRRLLAAVADRLDP